MDKAIILNYLKMIDIDEKKQKVLDFIKQRGPVLPVHVSRELGINSLFSSAILSEMVSSKMLKLSDLKVGGSPLYFIPGQEHMLENFTKFLGGKEKDTFELLKKNLILQEEKINPADKIALRNLKDFAVPIKLNTEEGEKIFWKIYSLSNEEAIKRINMLLKPVKEKSKIERIEVKLQKRKEKEQIEEKNIFLEKINKYLKEKEISVIKENLKKKKEIEFIVSAPSSFGKIEMLLISKDKKVINEADLSLAFSQGQASKLPILFLYTGKLTKKAEMAIENFKNSLFVRQL